MPTVICETVDPMLLGCKIMENCQPNSGCDCGCEIPGSILACLSGCLCGQQKERVLTVSLGFFSVLRIERPCQYLISATEYSVPDKVCIMGDEEDPCSLFSKMVSSSAGSAGTSALAQLWEEEISRMPAFSSWRQIREAALFFWVLPL